MKLLCYFWLQPIKHDVKQDLSSIITEIKGQQLQVGPQVKQTWSVIIQEKVNYVN